MNFCHKLGACCLKYTWSARRNVVHELNAIFYFTFIYSFFLFLSLCIHVFFAVCLFSNFGLVAWC